VEGLTSAGRGSCA